MAIQDIRTYIYKKPHRSGRVTWIIKWLDPETDSWVYKTAGRTQKEAELIQARVHEALFPGENPQTPSFLRMFSAKGKMGPGSLFQSLPAYSICLVIPPI